MLHDPIHGCLNAGIIAEVNTLDAGVTREAHVNKLTNDSLVHINSYSTYKQQTINTMKVKRLEYHTEFVCTSSHRSEELEMLMNFSLKQNY